MKAWQMTTPGGGLRLAELPDPVARGGGATLDVLAAQVPAYTDVLVAGGRGGFPTPIVLGPCGIGRVTATADDVFGVRQGDVVVATGLFRSGRVAQPEEAILAWTGLGGDGRPTPTTDRMRDVWRNGLYAERAVQPERTLVALPGADTYPDPERLAFLPWLGIAAEALERAGVRAGHVVAVVGATGQLGGAAVLVALALGASAVVAVGRNRDSLDSLAGIDRRVVPVPLTGDRGVDGRAIAAAGDRSTRSSTRSARYRARTRRWPATTRYAPTGPGSSSAGCARTWRSPTATSCTAGSRSAGRGCAATRPSSRCGR